MLKNKSLMYGRNFPIGRNHLTSNGYQFLCRVKINLSSGFPLINITKGYEINKNTTCHICLKIYEGKDNPLEKLQKREIKKIEPEIEDDREADSYEDWVKKYGHSK